MKSRARQLYLPIRIQRRRVPPIQGVSMEARRLAGALRVSTQDLIDFSDPSRPPDVIYHLKPRPRVNASNNPKEKKP